MTNNILEANIFDLDTNPNPQNVALIKPSHSKRVFGQAAHIINRFGGARSLSRALALVGEHRDPSTIYKWTYPKSETNGRGGTGGVIPSSVWSAIIRAAHVDGIVLTTADFEVKYRVNEDT